MARTGWCVILAAVIGCSQPVLVEPQVVVVPGPPRIIEPPIVVIHPNKKPATTPVIVAPTVIVHHDHQRPVPPNSPSKLPKPPGEAHPKDNNHDDNDDHDHKEHNEHSDKPEKH